jgi:hypothetical protein
MTRNPARDMLVPLAIGIVVLAAWFALQSDPPADTPASAPPSAAP